MASGFAVPTHMEKALECFGPHDHLCSIYENEQDHFAVAIPFIRIGLARREKCVYITDAECIEGVRKAMLAGGIDVDGAIASGALALVTKDQTYLRRGSFDPEWMFTYWQEAAEQAQREGFAALRATGETEWVVRGGPGMERWMEYESRLTHALEESDAFALCQYNRRLFPPELILDVIRTHPTVIYRDTVCRNFYFVPPDEFLNENSSGREVERLLTNIRDRELLDNELRRAQGELERRVEERTAVLLGINRILTEGLACDTEEELGRRCLQVAEQVTGSKFGFIGELSASGRLDDIAISDPGWNACAMTPPTGQRKIPNGLEVHGIYGRVLLDGKGLFTNSPETHPDRIGVPDGHPPLTAFLGAPLLHAGKTIGMIGMGNAEGGYHAQSLEALEALAVAVVQVLLSKRAEVAARRGEERFREAQKMESIGVLAGGIAHDFNNLLVGVIGNASVAQDILPATDAVQPFLRLIVKSGEQAAYLTRQLLAYAGKGGFLLEPVDMSAVVEDSKELIQGTVSKKIPVQFRLQKRLPVIDMDRSQMQQIVMNLVTNAAEAIGSDAGRITVSTGTCEISSPDAQFAFAHWNIQSGPCVFLRVSDTGCGMTSATQARIFEPFFTTKFQGRGLGLSAVAGIVRTLNGAIRVESEPGVGTTFTVLLPVTGPERAAPAAPVEEAREVAGKGVVLFVDDEEIVRETARRALERHGYTVRLAQSGVEAIETFQRDPDRINLIVLDLGMPGLSGEETLPRLRSIRPGVEVIVSSGHAEGHALRGFAGMPVSGFIQKPYTSHALASAVGRVLA